MYICACICVCTVCVHVWKGKKFIQFQHPYIIAILTKVMVTIHCALDVQRVEYLHHLLSFHHHTDCKHTITCNDNNVQKNMQ